MDCHDGDAGRSIGTDLLERLYSRYPLAENQVVDIVRPLVGGNAFQIGHVAHYGVLIEDAIGAVNISRHTCDAQRDVDIVHFSQRNHLG